MRRYTFPAMALVAMTALALPAVAAAQTPRPEARRIGPPGRMAEHGMPAARILELREELGLTDAQVERIRGIQTELQAQNRPLLEQLSNARREMRAAREQMTAEQREQMQQQREQMQQRRAAMRDSMQARAELTPEQRDQMRAAMQQRREARQRPEFAGRHRASIPDELRPVVEQLRTNTENAMQQVRSTLTAEQQEKLRELRPAQRRQGEP
ncbi:MAG: Spy/CpxP family protein refolding chaperone, partial [Longimicrobiales bacterium]